MFIYFWLYAAIILICLTLILSLLLLWRARHTSVFVGFKAELVFWIIVLGVPVAHRENKPEAGVVYCIIAYTSIRTFTMFASLFGNPQKSDRHLDLVLNAKEGNEDL